MKISCDGTTAAQGDAAVDGSGKDYDGTADEATQSVKYGTTVTCTLQAYDGTTVAAKPVAKAGVLVNIADSRGVDGAAVTSLTNTVVTTDAAGAGTYVTTIADPGLVAGAGNEAANYQILTLSNNAANTTALAAIVQGSTNASDAIKGFMWDDTARAEESVVVTATRYVDASSVGTGATNTVTATSYDQYGVGVAGNTLTLSTSAAVGLGQATTSTFSAARTANSSGVATWGVTRDSADDLAETFSVTDGTNSGTFTAYWPVSSSTTAFNSMSTAALIPDVAVGADWTTNTQAQLVVVDTANDTFIVHVQYGAAEGNTCTSTVAGDDRLSACTHVRYTYDSDDAFMDNSVGQTYAQFETTLATMEALGTNHLVTAVDLYGGGGTAIGNLEQAIPGNASHWNIP